MNLLLSIELKSEDGVMIKIYKRTCIGAEKTIKLCANILIYACTKCYVVVSLLVSNAPVYIHKTTLYENGETLIFYEKISNSINVWYCA